MQVRDPSNGQVYPMPTTPLARGQREVAETRMAEKFDNQGKPNGILDMDDRPVVVAEDQWRAYLGSLARFARDYPAALAAVREVQNASTAVRQLASNIHEEIANAKENRFFVAVGAALARDGIRLESTGVTDRTNGPLYRVICENAQGDPPLLPISERSEVSAIVARAQMAAGVLPAAARGFAESLSPEARAALNRVLQKGTASYGRFNYTDRYEQALYSSVEAVEGDDHSLTVRFETFSDGPGRVVFRAPNPNELVATLSLDYYGSDTEIVLYPTEA